MRVLNGERDTLGEFWKPATKYLIRKHTNSYNIATAHLLWIKQFTMGFMVGSVFAATACFIITNVDKLK